MERICYIYKNATLGDCTNNGASSRYDRMYYIRESQVNEYLMRDDINKDRILVLIERMLWGRPAWYLRPLVEPKGTVGCMFGGNYATVDYEDCNHPLPIHDRYETPEQYEILSR